MLSRSCLRITCLPVYSLCEKQVSRCSNLLVTDHHGYQTKRTKSTKDSFRSIVKNKKKILFVSSAMVQNKAGIIEMPFIIRRIGNNVFRYENNQSNKRQKETETFAKELQNCNSVESIFKLFMIPSKSISSTSAISALIKLHKLEQISQDYSNSWNLDSFLSQAVMDELFDVIAKDLHNVDNFKLIKVVEAYLVSAEGKYMDHVFRLAETQIAYNNFSVDELMQLSRVLQNSIGKYEVQNRCTVEHKDMHEKVWVHLINRTQDITPSNIVQILEEFPAEMKENSLPPLMNHVRTIGWHLQGQNMADILNQLIRLRKKDMKILEHMGEWASNIIQTVQPDDLADIIQAYRYYRFQSRFLINALEKYIVAKRDKIDIDLLCQALEYFRDLRYFSATSLDTAAFVFTKKGFNFTCKQMYETLIQFGFFNYLPSDSRKLFMVVEPLLLLHAYNFQTDKFLELICSFSYMSVKLVNFYHVIFSTKMSQRMLELDKNRCKSALFYHNRLKKGIPMHISQKSKIICQSIDCTIQKSTDQHRKRNKAKFHHLLQFVLGVSKDVIYHSIRTNKSLNTISVDCSFSYNTHHEYFYHWKQFQRSFDVTRVIIMVNYPEYRCVNTGHSLGEQAFIMEMVKKVYFDAKIIEIPFETLCHSSWSLEFLSKELSFIPKSMSIAHNALVP